MPDGGSELSEFQKRRRLKHTASPADISTGWRPCQLRWPLFFKLSSANIKAKRPAGIRQDVLFFMEDEPEEPDEEDNTEEYYRRRLRLTDQMTQIGTT